MYQLIMLHVLIMNQGLIHLSRGGSQFPNSIHWIQDLLIHLSRGWSQFPNSIHWIQDLLIHLSRGGSQFPNSIHWIHDLLIHLSRWGFQFPNSVHYTRTYLYICPEGGPSHLTPYSKTGRSSWRCLPLVCS